MLRLTTDEGIQGIAAGMAFEREREGLEGLIGPYLIGPDPTDIDTVRQRLREVSYLGWRNYWMEAALWDIKGKVEGKPVWALLGGKEAGVASVYASTGEVHPPEQHAEEVQTLIQKGFISVKLRVKSFKMSDDIAQIETVRQAVGEDIVIGADANQGWPVTLIDDAPIWDLERATLFAHECAELGIAWIEEPLDMHAYDELATLRQASRVPIAGGELNSGWHEFKVMFEKGSLDIYQPDATFGGGISDAVRVLNACQERGLSYTPHTWTNGLGFLINLHVFAAGPRLHPIEYPYEPPGWVPEVRDGILAEPIEISADGNVPIPNTAGLGIKIDEDKLEYFGELFFEITSRGIAEKTVREKGLFTT